MANSHSNQLYQNECRKLANKLFKNKKIITKKIIKPYFNLYETDPNTIKTFDTKFTWIKIFSKIKA